MEPKSFSKLKIKLKYLYSLPKHVYVAMRLFDFFVYIYNYCKHFKRRKADQQ